MITKTYPIEFLRHIYQDRTEIPFKGASDDEPGIVFSADACDEKIFWQSETDPSAYHYGGHLNIIPGQPDDGYSWQKPNVPAGVTAELLDYDDLAAISIWVLEYPAPDNGINYAIVHPSGDILYECPSTEEDWQDLFAEQTREETSHRHDADSFSHANAIYVSDPPELRTESNVLVSFDFQDTSYNVVWSIDPITQDGNLGLERDGRRVFAYAKIYIGDVDNDCEIIACFGDATEPAGYVRTTSGLLVTSAGSVPCPEDAPEAVEQAADAALDKALEITLSPEFQRLMIQTTINNNPEARAWSVRWQQISQSIPNLEPY